MTVLELPCKNLYRPEATTLWGSQTSLRGETLKLQAKRDSRPALFQPQPLPNCKRIRCPESELPGRASPKFLTHRNHERKWWLLKPLKFWGGLLHSSGTFEWSLMPTLPTWGFMKRKELVQELSECSAFSFCTWARKNKKHPHWKGRNKTVTICRWHDFIYKKTLKTPPKNCY